MKQIFTPFLCLILLISGAKGQQPPELVKDSLPKALSLDLPKELAQLRKKAGNGPLVPQIVSLGRKIFFDPVLSKDKTVACSSCHRPDSGFASHELLAVGIRGQKGMRNSPTVFNRGFGRPHFWDGRAKTLEEQVLMPIENPLELGHSLTEVLKDLRKDKTYRKRFQEAFGTNKSGSSGVTKGNLAKALAAFVSSLVLADSPVDRFHAGDSSALNTSEKRGLWIFESRGQCWQCHSGSNFSDESFHNTGVSWSQEVPDLGRFVITKKKKDARAFKTPTLRGLTQTAPYMHDGSMMSLRDVVQYYNIGCNPNDPNQDPRIKPLDLSRADKGALLAFLRALSRNSHDTSKKVRVKQTRGRRNEPMPKKKT